MLYKSSEEGKGHVFLPLPYLFPDSMPNMTIPRNGERLALHDDLFIANLLNHYFVNPNATLICDHHSNVSASCKKLLLDVLTLRDAIYAQLTHTTKADLLKPDVDVFICIMLPASYELLVAFIAIFALGAATAPIGSCHLQSPCKWTRR